MMYLSSLAGFWLTLVISILFSLSSHSIFFLWVGLELNMMSVIPIMASENKLSSSEVTLKYFVSQSIASVVFLFFYLVSTSFSPMSWYLSTMILFKLGLPPMHSWLTSIVMTSSYKMILLVTFIQKLIPLHILSSLPSISNLVCLAAGLTAMLTFSCLKNLASLRMTLLISAMSNSVWLVSAALLSNLWFFYLMVYGLFLSSTLVLLQAIGANKFSSIWATTPPLKLAAVLNFMNLGGLPPFSGFFIKLLFLKTLASEISMSFLLLILLLTLISLYAYLSSSYYLYSTPCAGYTIQASAQGLIFMYSIFSLASFPLLSMFTY